MVFDMALDWDAKTRAGSAQVLESLTIIFHGQGGSLFGIQIVNLFLNLVTLGIYSFWGRVRVRKYMLGQTEFAGDRFAYHGNGRELFIGWLKAMACFGLPILILTVWQIFAGIGSALFSILHIVIYILIGIFMPVAMVNARRYRLSRASWRAIRFSFRGGVRDFVAIYIKGWVLTLLTLGLYYPYWQNRRQTFMVCHSFFGNQRFSFDGQGRDLFWNFMLHILLTLPTVFLCWIWYAARVQRYYAEHTSFRQSRFRSTVSGGGLFSLWLGNTVLFVSTLGLAWSWIAVRNARYYVDHLALVGALDTAGVMQEARTATATGEGLAGFLELDFDLG
jgi:uncharacterized membrane protein YjgN (DUF898 family)